MTLGGFTAYLRIARARVCSGFNEIGETIFHAEMEMEGKLSEFYYSKLKKNLLSKANAETFLDIEFEDHFQQINHESKDKKYIGDIRLRDEEEDELFAFVRVTLPSSMFSVLKSMNGKTIKVDTIHDLISNPNEDQKSDNIVALVKRIYFQISNDLLEEKPRKKFSISFG